MKASKIDLKLLKKQAQDEIARAGDLSFLNEVFKKYSGRQGKLTEVLRSLEKLPKAQRVKTGKAANELKNFLKVQFSQRAKELKEKFQRETEEKDITRPGKRPVFGHLHPFTLVKRKAEEIFQAMGFSLVRGPEMEDGWHNFDALNVPEDHPARDMWDTFYLKNGLLLRTHTTAVDVRYMEKNNPPLRIITTDRCFRHEATDASHETNFYQLDGLEVGKDINVANFRAIVQEFFQRFFGKPVKIRMRPGYFPFTEPSFEVDMICLNCQGKGCSACSQTGWMEMMGAGMVHPNVFKAAGYNPKNWQGWAFGMGVDRLAMMKYKINDIRLFYGGDLRFLQQF
jgi:phenylalanyl-tRNA synthetase alpha chain